MSIATALASTVSAAVVVAGLSSALVNQQGNASVQVLAAPPSAVQVSVQPGWAQTSWAEPASPGLVDVHGRDVALAVMPSEGSSGAMVEVRACPRAWAADGTCAQGSWALLERAPMSARSASSPLALSAPVTHLRVTSSVGASLVFTAV